MAVPAEIRAVPRPVNTIVDDSGTNSPKRQKPNVQEGVQERMLNRLSDFYSPTDWECFNCLFGKEPFKSFLKIGASLSSTSVKL